MDIQRRRVRGTSLSTSSRTSGENPLLMEKWPKAMVPKTLSIDVLEGKGQLKMQKCRFNLCCMSFRPPPDEINPNYTIVHFRNLRNGGNLDESWPRRNEDR